MQKHGQPLSQRFVLRHHRFFEYVVLDVVRQISPNPRNSLTECATDLFLRLCRDFFHVGIRCVIQDVPTLAERPVLVDTPPAVRGTGYCEVRWLYDAARSQTEIKQRHAQVDW
jgi:hypothetical protein